MATKTDGLQAELIDGVLELVREKLAEERVADAEEYVRRYYADVSPQDLLERSVADLYGAALAQWQFAQQRAPGEAKVRVYTPDLEEHGWQSTHTVVEVVNDDMPFLVDSVTMELDRHGLGVHLTIHPVMWLVRDADGRLAAVVGSEDDSPAVVRESLMHVEVDRQTEPETLDEIRRDLLRVLADVRAAVEDWPRMRDQLETIVVDLDRNPPPVDAEETAEAKELLRWIHAGNFILLGYREYDLLTEGEDDVLHAKPSTGLGILRERGGTGASRSFAKLPPEARKLARAPNLLNLTKANSRSTVHRPSYLDYVGIKAFDAAGEVSGERRFLGLYTSVAYRARPAEIPILRRKVAAVLERSGFLPGSHNHNDLLDILETFPRDELFQVTVDELAATAIGILHLGERKRVRLFARRDAFGRFVSCLVFVPRERYTTETRLQMQGILQEAFGGLGTDFSVRLTEGPLARVHFIIRTDRGSFPDYDAADVERRLVQVTRSWTDDLHDALVDDLGEEHGIALFRKYAEAFPPAYRADVPARMAVPDVERLERLDPAGDLAMSLYRPLEAPEGSLRFKLLRSGQPVLLSDVLPLLENMGVQVVDERPYEIRRGDDEGLWIYDFGLLYGKDGELETDRLRDVFQDAFARAWGGHAESDGFNRLVLAARLTWREIAVLRAFCKYLRQAGSPYSQGYMEDALSAYPHVARLLVQLFDVRFDPARDEAARGEADRLEEEIGHALDAVPTLDEDRILRSLFRVTQAVLRTNYFQMDESGRPKAHLSFKLDPAQVPDLPLPRPTYEIFVYSPRTEGVHLRAGKVARGGIRWSDRREDFRTEVLGLMKAQTVKNAVIVPVGAKGGFVVKRPPADGDRDALQVEVVACYRTLISGMLDLTDNIVDGEVVAPADTVRYDGDDPYLVVAADKGTATFSDIANSVASEYGFWLGDAFASGGSTGYDHKAIGITARGAWESVKRHFRELGLDVETTEFTAVGIGDMSGDVFGNGMLLSRHIKLVGAFDHRHLFLDPDPDPERSFRERERLFRLPRSSWADYDPEAISRGGGVFPRTAKSVPLSEEVRRALAVDAEALPPNEVVRAILRAPADLLWNGGIGTFVKATAESDADVGDKANDTTRVDAPDLRCRVVGEGGNLGFTQLARIEFALAGGRVNTDFIDNSGGVDCSDHEVNIKILLDAVVRNGDLTEKQRNELIAEMTDEVARLVLRNNYRQTQALSLARKQAASMIDVHGRFIRSLEQSGRLDRGLEFLPSDETVGERKAARLGFTDPELAILLAYSKIALYDELLASDVPEDPYLSLDLERYLPKQLTERFRSQLEDHRLRREIIATFITNSMVNRAGITFAFRVREETGSAGPEIARAYAVAREVFAMPRLWADIEALDNVVPADTQLDLLLEARKLVERAARWLLRNRRQPLDISDSVSYFEEGVPTLTRALPELLVGSERETLERTAEGFAAAGVPEELAMRAAALGRLLAALDIVDVAAATALPVSDVGAVYFTLGADLELHWLREQIARLPRDDRWQTLARASLREDLYAQQRQLTLDVLEARPATGSVDGAIEAWKERNGPAVERCRQALDDIRLGAVHNLTTLSVALREVRNLTRVGAPDPVPSSGGGRGDGRGDGGSTDGGPLDGVETAEAPLPRHGSR